MWKHIQKHHKIVLQNEQQIVNTQPAEKQTPVILCQPIKQNDTQIKSCLICKKCKNT